MRIEGGKLDKWREMKGEAPDQYLKVTHHMLAEGLRCSSGAAKQ